MRSITLSRGSVFGAQSLPSLFPKPPKPLLTCYLLSLKSHSKTQSSKLFLHNPSAIFSRWSSLLNTHLNFFFLYFSTLDYVCWNINYKFSALNWYQLVMMDCPTLYRFWAFSISCSWYSMQLTPRRLLIFLWSITLEY